MNTPIMILFAAAALVTAPVTAQEPTTVLKGATILTSKGQTYENGVLILAGNKISKVGDAELPVPEGVRVIDVSGKTITAGLVDAGTSLSVSRNDSNEQASEVTPHMQILDAVDPGSEVFAKVRRHGVTTVQINPGNRNVIGGLGAILKTHGGSVAGMLVKQTSGLRVTMGSEPGRGNRRSPTSIYYRRPTTRMGVVWAVRKSFYDALAYREDKSIATNAPAENPAFEVLLQVLDGKVVVHTTARAEQDIRTALRLSEEFGYKTVIEGAVEAYRVPELLAKAGVKVIFAPPSSNGAGNPDGASGRYHTLNLLAKAGVPFAIQTEASIGERQLVYEAMVAMRNGLQLEDTLKAVTLVPAQVLGIDDRVGSLEAGKDADVVVWSGKPFQPTTKIERVFINGKEVVKP